GKPFTEASIGNVVATRNLIADLRSAGAITGGPKPFAPRDRSTFLSALDAAIVRLTRAGFGTYGCSAPRDTRVLLPVMRLRGVLTLVLRLRELRALCLRRRLCLLRLEHCGVAFTGLRLALRQQAPFLGGRLAEEVVPPGLDHRYELLLEAADVLQRRQRRIHVVADQRVRLG